MDYYESKIFHYFINTFGLFSLVLVMCLWGEQL